MNQWQVAWDTRLEHFAPHIGFARPHRTLAVSLTGSECALNCAHCAGHYLRQMVHIQNADATGMASCLISGGCDARGKVPAISHRAEIAKLG